MHFFVYFTMNDQTPMNPPTPEGMAQMTEIMRDAFDKGMVVSTGQMPQTVSRVTLEKGNVSVTDGPFIEGKEFIPGFTVIDTATKQEAIEWATKLRECMGDGTMNVAQLSATSL